MHITLNAGISGVFTCICWPSLHWQSSYYMHQPHAYPVKIREYYNMVTLVSLLLKSCHLNVALIQGWCFFKNRAWQRSRMYAWFPSWMLTGDLVSCWHSRKIKATVKNCDYPGSVIFNQLLVSCQRFIAQYFFYSLQHKNNEFRIMNVWW